MSKPRYAVYYAPAADSALWRFGSATLGYDATTGGELPGAVPPGCEALDWTALTTEPRRYGFHATLKAPFELSDGRSEGALRAFARNYVAGRAPVGLKGLAVDALGHFVALTPAEPSQALQTLAFDVVQAFEPFRAPLSQADLARRLQSPLTPAHRAYLEAYGYPYVGDAFRFHMTLTGALPEADLAAVEAALAPVLAPLLPAPFIVDALTLLGADGEGRFHQIARVPLTG